MPNHSFQFSVSEPKGRSGTPPPAFESIEFLPTSSFLQNIVDSLSIPRGVQTSDRTQNGSVDKRRANRRQARAVSSALRPPRRSNATSRHQSRRSLGNVPVSPIEALASVAAHAESSTFLERPSKRARSEVLASPQYTSATGFHNQASRPATSHIPTTAWSRHLEAAIDNGHYSTLRAKSQSNTQTTELSAAETLLELFHSNTPRLSSAQPILENGQQHESPQIGSNGLVNSIWGSALPYTPAHVAQHHTISQNRQSGNGSPEYMDGVESISGMQTHTPPEEIENPAGTLLNGSANSAVNVNGTSAMLDHKIQPSAIDHSILGPPKQLHSPQSLPSAPEGDDFKHIHEEQIGKEVCQLAQKAQNQHDHDFARPLDPQHQGLGISVSSAPCDMKAANALTAQADVDDSQATISVDNDPQTTMDEETKCAQCGFFANSLAGETIHWTQCDGCERWFHLSCTKIKPKEISRIDKYFCSECEKTHGPPTFFRKSARNRTNVDYKGLNEGTFSTVEENYEHRYIKHFKNGTLRYVMPENFPRVRPEEITAEYLEKLPNFSEPLVIPAALNPRPKNNPSRDMSAPDEPSFDVPEEAELTGDLQEVSSNDYQDKLDMVIPDGLTIRRVAELHGVDQPLEVIDVKAQEGDESKKWTVGKWADYYESPGEKPIRNVISLEVSKSRLGRLLRRPKAVRQLDLQDAVWPVTDTARVPVKFYVLMSVADCYTDFHIDFGGSSVYYHILKGQKVFFFIPPTASNLKKYEQWNKTAAQGHTFLPDQTKECYRVDLFPGDTMLIPSGWIHAVWTPTDSLVIGGNFLTRLHLGMQIKIHEIEKACGVPIKYRYPHFQKVLWYLLIHYLETDPLPETVEDLILNKGQPFSRTSPIWSGIEPTFEQKIDSELFNARYYAKSEVEGWPDLVQFIYRTALIFHDRIDGMTKEKRAAVSRSIPKTHGDPLELVRKFAAWVAWKTGNVLPPDWVYSESALPVRIDGKAEKDFKPAVATRKNPERTSHRLGPKKVVCDTCREKKIACKHVDASGTNAGPPPGLATGSSSTSNRPSPPAPSTPKSKANSVEAAIALLDEIIDAPALNASAKKDKDAAGKNSANGEGKRRWGKACVDCRKSKRRCIHDENGKVDPDKQNAPAKGEGRAKRKSSGADETLQDLSLLDDPSMIMDFDTSAIVDGDAEMEVKHEIEDSVEDSAIDPALMDYAPPLRNAKQSPQQSPKTTMNGITAFPHTSPKSISPRNVRTGKSQPRSTPQTSPSAARHPRRSGSIANGVSALGMSASPPSSRKGSKASPVIPPGLTPEEEASLKVAIQLQAEEFGLRSRRSG